MLAASRRRVCRKRSSQNTGFKRVKLPQLGWQPQPKPQLLLLHFGCQPKSQAKPATGAQNSILISISTLGELCRCPRGCSQIEAASQQQQQTNCQLMRRQSINHPTTYSNYRFLGPDSSGRFADMIIKSQVAWRDSCLALTGGQLTWPPSCSTTRPVTVADHHMYPTCTLPWLPPCFLWFLSLITWFFFVF